MITPYEETSLSDHLIICGLGHVGSHCLSLLTGLGEQGIVITREASPELQAADTSRFAILFGDAREEIFLRQAGIERAKAVIAVTNDDLANVSIALDARRLNPNVAIVIRLFDQDLAAHLEKSMHIRRVLSASGLAAPAFLAATLGDDVQCSFAVEHSECLVEQERVDADSVWKDKKIGQTASETHRAVIALKRGIDFEICPPPDTVAAQDDCITLLRLEKKHRKKSGRSARPGGKGRFGFSLRSTLSGIRGWWREIPVALRSVAVALFLIVLFSVGVFHYAFNLSFIEALYFVVTTVTTVGYGDISLRGASPWLMLYGTFLMLCGAAFAAMLFSMITDLILRARLRDLFLRRTSRHRGHVIVAGLGRIGFRLVRDLIRNGEEVVAIEHRENGEFVQPAREIASVILGNAKTEETLRKAGLAGAKAVVAATDDDLANLSIGLAVKRARPDCRVVLRVFDSLLAEKMQQGLSVESVLSVSSAAAPTFIGSILCPDMLHGLVLNGSLVLLFHRTIAAGSHYEQCPASRMAENESSLLLKPAGSPHFAPVPPGHALHAGDEVLGAKWYSLSEGKAEP
jgi:Trk K+ transport system NAD-binding subunit